MSYGVPTRIRSDGGLQFASAEFADFAAKWGFRHTMSSPHYPQSNGHAESAVKAMKRLVQKASPTGHLDNDAFTSALLEWRNSPNADGLSPAEVIFGRQLRTLAPSHQSNFIPESSKLRARIISRRGDSKAKRRYDAHARPLRPIPAGTPFRIQHPLTKLLDTTGVVISSDAKRDYQVRTTSGHVYRRNRRFIRPDKLPRTKTLSDPDPPDKPESPTREKPKTDPRLSPSSHAVDRPTTPKRPTR